MSELVDRLWATVGGLQSTDVPAEVVTVAGHSVLDWFGCALAGSDEPLVRILRDEFGGSGHGDTSLVGTDLRLDPLRAAMVNGAAGHALDFDDSARAMSGHPTVPSLPALLAQAEGDGATLADVRIALVVAFEVMGRLGVGIGTDHYARGFHNTATMGVFGATAGVAHLMGLDREAFGRALGIAASNVSGVKANFGTMTKPLHPGQAAERGLLAARLAARGYTANPNALDGNQGVAQAVGSGAFDLDAIDRLDGTWLTRRTLFKHHAACHLTHAGIDATREVLDRPELHDVEPDALERIELTVNPSILDVCGIPDPTTGLEAKFSLRGTQALLVHGHDLAAVATFDDGPIREPRVAAFVDRVQVTTDPDVHAMETRVAVLVGGRRHEAHADVSRPVSDLALQGRMLGAKFDALAEPSLGGRTADLGAALDGDGELTVAELMRAAR